MDTVSESNGSSRVQGSGSLNSDIAQASEQSRTVSSTQSDTSSRESIGAKERNDSNKNSSAEEMFSNASRSRAHDKISSAAGRDTIAGTSLRDDAMRLMRSSKDNHKTIKNNTAQLVDEKLLPDLLVS